MSASRVVITVCSAVLIGLVVIVGGAIAFSHGRPDPTTPDSAARPSSSERFTIASGGVQRTYRVHTPAGLSAQAPLVVVLHGGGGSGSIVERYQGWDAEADAEKFIVAYPDGLGPEIPAWNTEGGCCGYPARKDVDDVRFIEDMVAAIVARTPVDPARIYAAGMSNGGMMAYTLACRSDLFAAIAAVSATQLDSCDDPQPTSVIHIHGLKDANVPFDGSPGEGRARIDGPPIPDVIAGWRRVDGCDPATGSTSGVVTVSTSACPEGRAVELITIADAEHGWPGSSRTTTRSDQGAPPSQALNATETIWQFFAAHPRP